MKWDKRQYSAALKGGDLPAFICVYGEDAGVVRDAVQKLAAAACPDLNDPFLSDKLSLEDILEDPATLVDAAGTMSLMGDRKLIQISGVNADCSASQLKKVQSAIETLLQAPIEAAVVLLSAAGLDNKSGLIKLIEKSPQAAALRLYPDSARDITTVITEIAASFNKKLDAESMNYLQENLGADRGITQSEIEKLCLYVGDAPEITLKDVLAVVAAAPSSNLFKLCDAIGFKKRQEVDRYLDLLEQEGTDMVMLQNAVMRHMKRLLIVKEKMAQGVPQQQALSALRPPVMAFAQNAFMAQVNKQSLSKLQKQTDLFYKVQLESRQGGLKPELVIKRAILSLAF